MSQYVYTMRRGGSVVPPTPASLKNISLHFFPGAKIGVLGLNGAGKSTLLKIMAGIDKEFDGEAIPLSGIKLGYLPKEPHLDPNKSVKQIVEEGLGESGVTLNRYNEISQQFSEPMNDEEMNRL